MKSTFHERSTNETPTYASNRTTEYSYDGDNNVVMMAAVMPSDETSQITHYVYGVTATSSGTGAGDQYAGLDRFGRITDQKWTNSSGTIDEFQYTYDADGNVLTKNNMVLSGDDESFTYDNLNRLTAYNLGSNSESWSLDALGNWNSQTINGTTTDRTTSAQNQVKTVGTATLGYDNDGNTLTDQTGQQYVYDAWNRLVAVKNSSGSTIASYTYDAEGRRITQTESGTTTDLYYSDRWQVIEEDVSGSATVQFTWGPFYVNQLIASDTFPTGISIGIGGGDDDPHGSGHGDDVSVEVAGRSYAEQDADYDVTSMTDDGGAVQERYQYDPTGNVVVLNPTGTTLGAGMNSSTIGQVIGYQGGWTDSSTGLVTFQYRDLNTGLGRWIEQDPDGYVNGPNTYQFELSSAVGNVDSSGLDAKPAEPTAPLPFVLPIVVDVPGPAAGTPVNCPTTVKITGDVGMPWEMPSPYGGHGHWIIISNQQEGNPTDQPVNKQGGKTTWNTSSGATTTQTKASDTSRTGSDKQETKTGSDVKTEAKAGDGNVGVSVSAGTQTQSTTTTENSGSTHNGSSNQSGGSSTTNVGGETVPTFQIPPHSWETIITYQWVSVDSNGQTTYTNSTAVRPIISDAPLPPQVYENGDGAPGDWPGSNLQGVTITIHKK